MSLLWKKEMDALLCCLVQERINNLRLGRKIIQGASTGRQHRLFFDSLDLGAIPYSTRFGVLLSQLVASLSNFFWCRPVLEQNVVWQFLTRVGDLADKHKNDQICWRVWYRPIKLLY